MRSRINKPRAYKFLYVKKKRCSLREHLFCLLHNRFVQNPRKEYSGLFYLQLAKAQNSLLVYFLGLDHDPEFPP